MNAVPVDPAFPPRLPLFTRVVYGFVILIGTGVIASFMFPVSGVPQAAAQQARALSNARQIVGALRTYATDHDGKFPDQNPDGSPITSANQAFRALFPEYLTSERVFYVKGSAWTPAETDDVLDGPGERPGTNTLRSGENHFAYVRGLSDASSADLPLVADGFTAPAGGIIADPFYSDDKSRKGGRWEGRIAVVIHLDQSAEKVRLPPAPWSWPWEDNAARWEFRVPRHPKTAGGVPGGNLFSPDPSDPKWLQSGQGVVDPE